MEPDWLTRTTNDTYYTATYRSCQMSVFRTMFNNFTYMVFRKGRTKAGSVGNLEPAKSEVLRIAKELEA